MKAVIQRVTEAAVEIEGNVVGEIEQGFVVLLGIGHDDEEADAEYLAGKIAGLRVFEDEQQKMNLSLRDVNGAILAISQFTLYANTRKGRRPSFIEAALPEKAEPLYQFFIKKLRENQIRVAEGVFGATMMVKIFNHGPVTILLNSADRHKSRRD
jgi:D-tyrosyl-tRNA(Tyr) deacylase